MQSSDWRARITSFDDRRDLVIPGDEAATLRFCLDQFLQIARESIAARGRFTVALSGGSTPHALFKQLSQAAEPSNLDWSKVLCFWSDERSVPPNDPESNYSNAMQAGLAEIPILPEHLFRMHAEGAIEEHAKSYERLIREQIPSLAFDLVMLGMGEDGHTASLFPFTQGLHAEEQLIIANYVPQKQTWRMSMTYACIHKAHAISLYVLGSRKAAMAAKALLGPYDPDRLPVQRLGTPSHKALWILDRAAAEQLAAPPAWPKR